MLASVAVVAIVIWTQLGGRQRLFASMVGAFLLSAAAIFFAGGLTSSDSESLADIASRSGEANELSSLTGRVDIWGYAWNECLASPLVGYGYGASRFALQEDPNYPFKFEANHAHNLWLNTVLTTGFPGALLLLAMVVHLLLMNLRRPSAVPSIALGLIVVSSVTEPLLYTPMPHAHMFIWLIAVFWQQMGMDTTPLPGIAATPTSRRNARSCGRASRLPDHGCGGPAA